MTRRIEELVEYERRELALDASTARDLQTIAGNRLFVSLGSEHERFIVEATQYVGTVVLPEVEILIRPKINPENLFLLLGVGMPSRSWQRATFGYAGATNLLAAFAAFFARTLERALGQGLTRSYVEERSRMVAMRGRIDFKEAVRAPWLASPIACVYDEYTADIAENRLLKAALRRLRRLPGVPSDVRRLLLRELVRFEEVSDDWIDPASADRIVFTRLNQHYRPAIELAALILRNVTLLDRAGANDASAFLIDMNDLFQRFMSDRLEQMLRKHLHVHAEPPRWLDVKRKVSMAPDLVFERRGRTVYVADLKYKLSASGWGQAGDYYQLLAYATSMGLAEGALIYCQGGDATRREILVRNTNTRLVTFPIDLSGNAVKVEEQISALARWIRSRTQMSTVEGIWGDFNGEVSSQNIPV